MPETASTRQMLRAGRKMFCLAPGLFVAEVLVLTSLFWIRGQPP